MSAYSYVVPHIMTSPASHARQRDRGKGSVFLPFRHILESMRLTSVCIPHLRAGRAEKQSSLGVLVLS